MLGLASTKVRAMKEPLYRAEIEADRCAVDFRANDIPVFAGDGRVKMRSTIMLNLWIQKGENILIARLNPAPGSADMAAASFSCKATVQDMAVPKGSREIVTLTEINFDSRNDTKQYPLGLPASVDVPTAFPQWAWLAGPPLRVDDSTLAEARAVLERIHGGLAARKLDDVMAAQQTRIREMAAALYSRVVDVAADIRSDITAILDSGQFSLAALEWESVEYPLFGNRRLIKPFDRRGFEPVRLEASHNMVSEFPMYLTRDEAGRLIWIR